MPDAWPRSVPSNRRADRLRGPGSARQTGAAVTTIVAGSVIAVLLATAPGLLRGDADRSAAGATALQAASDPAAVVPSPGPVGSPAVGASAAPCPSPTPPASPAPSSSPAVSASPVPSASPDPSATIDPCATVGADPSAEPGASAVIGPTLLASSPPSLPPRSSPAPAASVAPSASPRPVVPGGIRAKLDVPMTGRLRCYEFPRNGCVNRADIYYPRNKGGWPTVVTIHGRPRTPADMRELARALARRGAVVFNADYRGVRPVSRGFPESVEDVACAIRFARANTAKYGGDPDHIVLVGHSMGGYVGMMVSVAGERIAGRGEGCLVDAGSSLPDGFVHVAGVSSTKASEPLDTIFFGGSYAAIPDVWRRGDVFNQIARGGNDDLEVGIIFELHDPYLGYGHATWLQAALKRAGYDSKLVLLEEGSTHFDVLDMDTTLGRRILAFTEKVIRRSAP